VDELFLKKIREIFFSDGETHTQGTGCEIRPKTFNAQNYTRIRTFLGAG
jgi:hypothetical protein